MTIRSLLGSTLLLLIFLILIVAGIFAFYPQWGVSTFGIGPLSPSGIWTLCLSLVIGLGALFWLVERLFERVGKSGLRVQWRKQQSQNAVAGAESNTQATTSTLFNGLNEQLRFRYGRFWRRKVRILWLTGDTELVEHIVPGLTSQQWQEGDGTVLIWGGGS